VEVAIGVDPAKGSLAVAAVDPLGRVLDAREFSNDTRGHRAFLGWVREHSPDRVIGIECSLSYGASLSRLLLHAGEDVREVPTTLTFRQRRRRGSQGKSDLIDSVAIARIVASVGMSALAAGRSDTWAPCRVGCFADGPGMTSER
jgi:transposase